MDFGVIFTQVSIATGQATNHRVTDSGVTVPVLSLLVQEASKWLSLAAFPTWPRRMNYSHSTTNLGSTGARSTTLAKRKATQRRLHHVRI